MHIKEQIHSKNFVQKEVTNKKRILMVFHINGFSYLKEEKHMAYIRKQINKKPCFDTNVRLRI